MKKAIFLILSILIVSVAVNWEKIFYFYLNDYQINQSSQYQELNKMVEEWSDKNYFVKPEVYLRFNSSNQGYYQTNHITILTKPETFFFNKDFLKVALAHEFGHHYVKIKFRMVDLSLPEEEILADLVAIDLVGKDLILKVLAEEAKERSLPEDIIDFDKRIKMITSISKENKDKLLDPRGLDNK